MIDTLTTVLWFLVAICVLVAIHEYGHFYVARRCGVKVLRFSIGFGRRLLTWRDRHGTEFAISAVPLGGYVKMLDEREVEVDESERHLSFNSKSVWQRIAIAAAGPLANFLLAILLYWFTFVLVGTSALSPVIGKVEPGSVAEQARLVPGQEILSIDGEPTQSRREVTLALINRLGESGQIRFTTRYPDSDLKYESEAVLDGWLKGEEAPDPVRGLGLEFYYPPIPKVIEKVVADSAADEAGMKAGDRLLAVDGVELDSWQSWVDYVRERPGVAMTVEVEREGKAITLNLTPGSIPARDGGFVGQAGVSVTLPSFPEEMVRRYDYGLFEAMNEAVSETWDGSVLVLVSLKKLIFGEISTKNLSGPIGIAKVAASHAEHGFWAFTSFLAYLSIMLGVLNLLPIPILDGGHILYCLVEWVKGSPVSEEAQVWGLKLGMVVLFGVMAIAFYNDILRL